MHAGQLELRVLKCQTGECGTPGQLVCGAGGNGLTPQSPVTQFENTNTLNAGYNVETKVTPVGRSGLPNLQVSTGGKVVGLRDPCDACTDANPPAGLMCGAQISNVTFTDRSGASHPVTFQDMYCAKNTLDGNAQASANQGTPTCFGNVDCPPGSMTTRRAIFGCNNITGFRVTFRGSSAPKRKPAKIETAFTCLPPITRGLGT